MPVKLACAKTAVFAFVHRQTACVLMDQLFDQLQVMPFLSRRLQQLRFQQFVEAEQRRRAPHFVTDQTVCRRRIAGGQRGLINHVEQIQRCVFLQVAAQQVEPLLGTTFVAIRLQQALGDQRQIGRVLRLDALPDRNGGRTITEVTLEIPQQHVRPHAQTVVRQRRFKMGFGFRRL